MNNPKLDHVPDAKPSATVVLLRDRQDQFEILMLQKNANINYGGSWVFPGGVCDPEDFISHDADLDRSAIEEVAKVTACRETQEEAGLVLTPKELAAFSHWTTPKFRMKRYATWFFVADASDLQNEVQIDDGEIIQARWFTAKEAIDAQACGEIMLNGPSFVILSQLSQFSSKSEALTAYTRQDVEWFIPRGHKTTEGVVTLYTDDDEYDSNELAKELPPRTHRLYMHKKGAWHYHRTA